MNNTSSLYDTIQISKNQIPKITANSGLLNIIIHSNFSNSENYKDNEGNFFLNRNTFPISNNEWRAFREAIEDGYVYDPKHRAFIKSYFMFKSNLVPPSNITKGNKGVYLAKPGRKQRQRTRKLERRLNENYFGPTKKELKKAELEEERELKEENELAKLQNVLENVNINKFVTEVEKAQRETTKYAKSGIRPSKTQHNSKKGQTLNRKMARTMKSFKYNKNNMNTNNNTN